MGVIISYPNIITFIFNAQEFKVTEFVENITVGGSLTLPSVSSKHHGNI